MAKKLAFDRLLFTAVLVLTAFGLTMVYSASAVIGADGASSMMLVKQGIAAGVGLVAMWILMHVDYRHFASRWTVYLSLGFVVAMLVLVLFVAEHNNTQRWLHLGPLSVQPSEGAKLAVVLYIAYQAAQRQERESDWELLFPVLVVVSLVAVLVGIEPDLGTAILILATSVIMLFLAEVRWRYFLGGALMLAPVLLAAIVFEPYRKQRLMSFLDPTADPQGAGFQAIQSLIAVGSGGLAGRGLGSSVQKLHYLPQAHSDFIYSILAEELGLIGALVLLALVAVVLWRGVRAGARAPEAFGRHLAWGLTALLVLQSLLHISVALALIPTTGIPLPFVSAGGSSMLASMAAAGAVLNISQHG